MKIAAKIAKIVDSLTEVKKAAASGGFAAFKKTQKTELQQMLVPEDAAAS